MSFDLNKSITAISAAMVGTIHTGDDLSRFAVRANAEGFTSISQFIASEALKQSLANEAALFRHFAGVTCATEVKLGEAATLIDFAGDGPEVKLGEAATLTDFTGKGPEVFANTAMVTDTTTNLEVSQAGKSAPHVTAPEDTTSTSTTTANVSNVDLDSEGSPWDGRIHSSNGKKLAKEGTWQLKRNVDPALVEQVKAELSAVMAIPAVPIITAGSATDANAFSVGTAGNGAQTVAVDTQATNASSINTFAQLMPAITKAKLEMSFVVSTVQAYGIPSLPALATRQDLIPFVAEALGLV